MVFLTRLAGHPHQEEPNQPGLPQQGPGRLFYSLVGKHYEGVAQNGSGQFGVTPFK